MPDKSILHTYTDSHLTYLSESSLGLFERFGRSFPSITVLADAASSTLDATSGALGWKRSEVECFGVP